MKKKLIVIALCFASMLNLIACGSQSATNTVSEAPAQSESAHPTEPSQESSSAIGVDKNLLTVDVTLPAMFWEDEDLSTFDAESYAKENGFNSAKVNDDGSVTINMSKARHTELLASFSDSVKEDYANMIGSEDYPYIKDIKYTNNFGKIDIYVDKDGYDSDWFGSAFLPLSAYISAAYYQALSGNGAKCQINIIDSSTNDTIGSVIYPDALQDSEAGTPVEQETKAASELESAETMGQKNALRQAKNYLNTMHFSYSGMIAQLEFEGYEHEDAVYGADNCGADWMEQAAKKAKQYLDIMAFSKDGLINQLEFDGFSHEQAVYGVEQNGY